MFLLPLFFLAYTLIWIALVVGVGIISWRITKSKKVASVLVIVAFLAMYWPAFGDLIPTIQEHKYYCEKEAGFKIYITPEQWAAENPGVLETLMPMEKFVSRDGTQLGNERIGEKIKIVPLSNRAIYKFVVTIVDIKTNKILNEYIDFTRGYRYGHGPERFGESLKIWLDLNSCYSYEKQKANYSLKNNFLKRLNANIK